MFESIAIKAAPILALLGFAIGGSQAHSVAEPLRCEIEASSAGGMISLEGIVFADTAVSGSYAFHVVSSGGGGSSNIRQGGAFAAGPDGAVTLGRVMLGGSGAYDASLTLDANGETIECAERIGGTL